ncbi:MULTISPECIES: endonuclease domain-containing protein [unclassified Streptomyces]|uniref:endonuclease domain-containing protein n=1 Tax=unclassified Streptomyces TaxID=2593676 RepID=UPI0038671DBD
MGRAVEGRAGRARRRHGGAAAGRGTVAEPRTGFRTIRPSGSAIHVDHRHRAGRVRDVPCFNCNSAIGTLGENPSTQRRATAYLEGNAWKPTLVAPGVYQLPS